MEQAAKVAADTFVKWGFKYPDAKEAFLNALLEALLRKATRDNTPLKQVAEEAQVSERHIRRSVPELGQTEVSRRYRYRIAEWYRAHFGQRFMADEVHKKLVEEKDPWAIEAGRRAKNDEKFMADCLATELCTEGVLCMEERKGSLPLFWMKNRDYPVTIRSAEDALLEDRDAMDDAHDGFLTILDEHASEEFTRRMDEFEDEVAKGTKKRDEHPRARRARLQRFVLNVRPELTVEQVSSLTCQVLERELGILEKQYEPLDNQPHKTLVVAIVINARKQR